MRAAAAERELGTDRVVQRHDDGAIDVSVPATNVDAFRSWVLGMVEHAVVLEPADVRASIVAWLQAVAGDQPSGDVVVGDGPVDGSSGVGSVGVGDGSSGVGAVGSVGVGDGSVGEGSDVGVGS